MEQNEVEWAEGNEIECESHMRIAVLIVNDRVTFRIPENSISNHSGAKKREFSSDLRSYLYFYGGHKSAFIMNKNFRTIGTSWTAN
jgi:hypothetical protein